MTHHGASGQRVTAHRTSSADGDRRPYRPEIDGLRAVAVFAVILNHVDARILPSGYLGVDIFFVISGYVITLSLFGKGANDGLGNFLRNFYERRSKRLLPALACFCLVFSLAVGIFNPEPEAMIRTGASALLGVSNLYLLKSSTDYFSHAANLNPFTHTWSLAVEEQFYLVFPLLVWFTGLNQGTKKSGIYFLIIAGLLSIFSLLSFVFLYTSNQAAAYFLMPTRFWEMAAGGLVLVAMKQRQNLAFQFKKVPSALVLAAILVLMLLPLTAAVPATIATVVLSAMMMASLEQGKGLGKVLSHKRVVWFGLISYSLYLWHWGVLSISRWTIGIHWWSVPFQLALIVLLAAISYRYIEKPFRTMSWGATPLATLGRSWLGVAGFVAAYLGIAKYIAPLFYIGPDPAGLQRDSISGVYIPCNYYRDRVSFEPETALQKCTYPAVVDKVGNSHVFYLGDSHAGQLGGLITRMREVPGLTQSVFYVGGAMSPPLNIEFYSKNDREWKRKDLKTQNAILGYVLSHAKQGDVLVLANGDFLLTDLWRNYRSDMKPVQKGERSDAIFYSRRLNSWKSSLEDLSKEVQHRGLHLVLIAPRPFFKTPVDAQGFALDYSTIHCGIMPELKRECQLRANRAALLEGLSQIRDYQDQLSNNYHAVKVYDPFPVLCPPAQTDCTTVVSGQLAYYDNHHLNGYGSGLLYEDFRKFLTTNNLIRI